MTVVPPADPSLSASQLARLAELGEEQTARAGDVLFKVGDPTYPFIAIEEGEVAVLDATGKELVRRHGPSSFLGELNLLSGQTVFWTVVATKPLHYIAVDRDVLRSLLFEDGPLSDLRTVDVHRAAGGPAARRRHRHRDSRPAFIRGDDETCSTSRGPTGCLSRGTTRRHHTVQRFARASAGDSR